jgi:hypothetical protein
MCLYTIFYRVISLHATFLLCFQTYSTVLTFVPGTGSGTIPACLPMPCLPVLQCILTACCMPSFLTFFVLLTAHYCILAVTCFPSFFFGSPNILCGAGREYVQWVLPLPVRLLCLERFCSVCCIWIICTFFLLLLYSYTTDSVTMPPATAVPEHYLRSLHYI